MRIRSSSPPWRQQKIGGRIPMDSMDPWPLSEKVIVIVNYSQLYTPVIVNYSQSYLYA